MRQSAPKSNRVPAISATEQGARRERISASWTPERRAAQSKAMKRRYRDRGYRERHRAIMTEANSKPERRASSSAWMRKLNSMIAEDTKLYNKVIRGSRRVRSNPAFKAIQSAVMKEVMQSPERRRQARYHMLDLLKRQRRKAHPTIRPNVTGGLEEMACHV